MTDEQVARAVAMRLAGGELRGNWAIKGVEPLGVVVRVPPGPLTDSIVVEIEWQNCYTLEWHEAKESVGVLRRLAYIIGHGSAYAEMMRLLAPYLDDG